LARLLEQPGLQDAQRGGLVLNLALLVLAADYQAGRQVGDANCRIGRVDGLAAGTRTAEDIDPDVGLRHVDMVGLLHDRKHLDTGEAGLSASLVVEGTDPHQAVGTLLDRQRSVGIGGLDGERGRLDAGLFGVADVVDLDGVAVTFGPALVHAEQHRREVGRVHPTCLGTDGNQRIAFVVLSAQQGTDLKRLDLAFQHADFVFCFGRTVAIAFFGGQFEQHLDIVQSLAQILDALDFRLQPREPTGHPLRIGLVVPQVRRCGFFLQLRDLDLL